MLCLFILLSIVNREYIRHTDSALTIYLYVNTLQSIMLLALWTPSIIKRLHDMDIRGNRVWIPWAALLLDAHSLMPLNIHFAELLEKLQPLLFVFYLVVLSFYLVLFLRDGTPGINNWGSPPE